jgi:hypothetical protein
MSTKSHHEIDFTYGFDVAADILRDFPYTMASKADDVRQPILQVEYDAADMGLSGERYRTVKLGGEMAVELWKKGKLELANV